MADINVERKRTSIWPWILGLIALALLIWAVAEMFETDEVPVEQTEMETVGMHAPALSTFPEDDRARV